MTDTKTRAEPKLSVETKGFWRLKMHAPLFDDEFWEAPEPTQIGPDLYLSAETFNSREEAEAQAERDRLGEIENGIEVLTECWPVFFPGEAP